MLESFFSSAFWYVDFCPTTILKEAVAGSGLTIIVTRQQGSVYYMCMHVRLYTDLCSVHEQVWRCLWTQHCHSWPTKLNYSTIMELNETFLQKLLDCLKRKDIQRKLDRNLVDQDGLMTLYLFMLYIPILLLLLHLLYFWFQPLLGVGCGFVSSCLNVSASLIAGTQKNLSMRLPWLTLRALLCNTFYRSPSLLAISVHLHLMILTNK